MIPHEELVAALKEWRQQNGLPNLFSSHESSSLENSSASLEEYASDSVVDEEIFNQETGPHFDMDSNEQQQPVELKVEEENLNESDPSEESTYVADSQENRVPSIEDDSTAFDPFSSNSTPAENSIYKPYNSADVTTANGSNESIPTFSDDSSYDSYYDKMDSEPIQANEAVDDNPDSSGEQHIDNDSPLEEELRHPFTDDPNDDFDSNIGEETIVGGVSDDD